MSDCPVTFIPFTLYKSLYAIYLKVTLRVYDYSLVLPLCLCITSEPEPHYGNQESDMNINQYLQAATRENTRIAYQASIEHFESQWGGFLPATADSVAHYLAHYAESLSINTLRQRLAALAAWHQEQGFPDPTKAPHVKKVIKGITALHPHMEKQAKPLCIEALNTVISFIDQQLKVSSNDAEILRLTRNKALFLLGFWRAFRSDELSRITIENVGVFPDQGMTIFLPRSKSDRNYQGNTYRAPVLQSLCPISA